MSYHEAFEKGLLKDMPRPTEEEAKIIADSILPKPTKMIHLLNPEDAKTEKDFLRLTFQEEDDKWREM